MWKEEIERECQRTVERCLKEIEEVKKREAILLKLGEVGDSLEESSRVLRISSYGFVYGEYPSDAPPPTEEKAREVRRKVEEVLEIDGWEKEFDGWGGYDKPRWYWKANVVGPEEMVGYVVKVYGASPSEKCVAKREPHIDYRWVCENE